MVAQTTYTKEAGLALPGLVYDVGNTNIDSFAAEGVPIVFGRFVDRGSSPEDMVIPGGSANAIGVAVRTARENALGGQSAIMQYEDTDTVGVLRSGFIWCEFDIAGGTVDAAVTLNAGGIVAAGGGGTGLVVISATVEKAAVAVVIGGTTVNVGLVNVVG